jgi:hypothetical protein
MAKRRQTKRTRGSKRKTGGRFFWDFFSGTAKEQPKEQPKEQSTSETSNTSNIPEAPNVVGGKRRTKKNKRRTSKK